VGAGEAAHRNITTEFDAAKMENWRPFNEKPRPMGIKGLGIYSMIGINFDRGRRSPCDPVPCRDRDP